MRIAAFGAVIVLVMFFGAGGAHAAPGALDPADLQNLLKTLESPGTTEDPRIQQSPGGFVTFIGAPFGGHFATPTSEAKSIFDPGTVAEDFLSDHAGAFGIQTNATILTTGKIHARQGRSIVRLKQSYGGVPVFAGAVSVIVDENGGVEAVLSDIMRDTELLDAGAVSLSPSLSGQVAARNGIADVAARTSTDLSALTAPEPELFVYRPSVVGNSGTTRLIWNATVTSTNMESPVAESLFMDAHSGEVIFHYSLIHSIKNREIHDAAFGFEIQGNLVRAEGDPPTGIADVDQAYDYLGGTYDFYLEEHGRDSYDGLGSPIVATVRNNFAIFNAFWFGAFEQIVFGPGMTADDVAAHELTHGLTQFTSGLLGFNEAGAMGEHFSDAWGEFVDQTRITLNDGPESLWLIGEDLPGDFLSIVGTANPPARALRNMENPPEFIWFPFDGGGRVWVTPDRLRHPDFYRGVDDAGGVHFNNGVGNKLVYLMVEGGTFNGFTIDGMGISLVADLLFEVEHFLTPGATYFDYFAALGQASGLLGLDFETRQNILAAATAVEITPPRRADALGGFRAIPARDEAGDEVIVLEWQFPSTPGFSITNVVRKGGSFPTSPIDGQVLELEDEETGASGFLVDVDVVAGNEYFYTIFWDSQLSFPGASYARATGGAPPLDFLTEYFDDHGGLPIDLAFSQILFSPVIDAVAAAASGRPLDYVNLTDYVTSIRKNVFELPVARVDEHGGSFDVPMTEDGYVQVTLSNLIFPLLGQPTNSLFVASNGYVSFSEPCTHCGENFPSLNSHADDLRISFLFADLGFDTGGNAWIKGLPDRLVITYERVPEYTISFPFQPPTNTVQVELFFSGHIRVTYLELGVSHAVVGLSDGNGFPVDPALFLPGTPPILDFTDFSHSVENNPNRLTLWPPVPSQFVVEGDLIEFTVNTNSPNEVPRLEATWNRPEPVPFADNQDGTGTFRWVTDHDSAGTTNLSISAATTFREEAASQLIQLIVNETLLPPEARNLAISTGTLGEDVFADRDVDDDSALIASYDYFHPESFSNPLTAAEGITTLQWYRNGAPSAALTNVLQVPPEATRPGDEWFFTVLPRTVFHVEGVQAISPVVTISNTPVVVSLSPNGGSFNGGTRVRITGRRLSNPESVTFSGIAGIDLISLGDEELEVITPAGHPGPVDVVIKTQAGSTRIRNGFIYATTDSAVERTDVNGDGVVNAVDVQLVANAVLAGDKVFISADTNTDGHIDSADLQMVVNTALVLVP